MNKKNIFIIIIVVLLVMLAFWYLGNSSSTAGDSSLSVSQTSSESADAQYIYNLLQQMSQVKLDDSIFSDPSFQNLKDNTVSFSAQPSGRNNPFAPIGTTGAPAQTGIKVQIK